MNTNKDEGDIRAPMRCCRNGQIMLLLWVGCRGILKIKGKLYSAVPALGLYTELLEVGT